MLNLKFIKGFVLLLVLAGMFSSCGVYRRSIMFQTEEENWIDSLYASSSQLASNYVIQPNDYLFLSVYANSGELLIDPNMDLRQEFSANMMQVVERPRYLVRQNGEVNLPMVGLTSLEGYTIAQADSLLVEKYADYYADPFVLLEFANRRVSVFGPEGAAIVPLTNENMNLVEVLAIYGGVSERGKAHIIRLIRGDLKDPHVQLIDLTTIEGMKQASLRVETNDIVYVERIRKPVAEAVQDVSPIFSIITSVLTLVFLISRS